MKIKIISISDSEKHFKISIDEYKKRLWKDIEIINIKQIKWNNINQIKENETNKLIEYIKKFKCYKILLSIEWELIDSIEFKNIIENNNYNIAFIIWWPFWLIEKKIVDIVNMKISLWRITLPHWLCKLTLIEQIYRTKTIIDNKKYHY